MFLSCIVSSNVDASDLKSAIEDCVIGRDPALPSASNFSTEKEK